MRQSQYRYRYGKQKKKPLPDPWFANVRPVDPRRLASALAGMGLTLDELGAILSQPVGRSIRNIRPIDSREQAKRIVFGDGKS